MEISVRKYGDAFYYTLYILVGHRNRDRMVVGFITTNAISVYHH